MKKKEILPVLFVSMVLIIYSILIFIQVDFNFAILIFSISPFLMIWMVYSVVRHGVYNGPDPEPGEEWRYADKNKDDLGVF